MPNFDLKNTMLLNFAKYISEKGNNAKCSKQAKVPKNINTKKLETHLRGLLWNQSMARSAMPGTLSLKNLSQIVKRAQSKKSLLI